MKVKTLVMVTVLGALGASAAIAAPLASAHRARQARHAHHAHHGRSCKPKVVIILHGTVATAPGADPALPFGLMVHVKATNKHGEAYLKASQPVTVTVTSGTKVSREGSTSLSSLLQGDVVAANARVCSSDLANGATPPLTATVVTARPAAHKHP